MAKPKYPIPSTAIGRRRLLKLADLLEEDASNKKGIKFYFNDWGFVGNPKKPLSCETSGCAMGLAAISGAFKRAGLGYNVASDGRSIAITFNGMSKGGIEAAKKLFDINFYQAAWLFADSNLMTASHGATAERQVARKIRGFVAGRISHRWAMKA